jgi:hypothetical protein
MSIELEFEEYPGDSPLLPRPWVLDATWGTPGGMQYRHLEFAWNNRSRVLLARSRHTGEPVGMHLWLRYPWGFLRHMMVVPPPHQRRGIAHALMAEGRRHFGQQLGPTELIAGIVDSTHDISRRLSTGAGYEVHRQFDLWTFSRRFPRRSPHVRRAGAEEIQGPIRCEIEKLGRGWNDFPEQASPSNTWVYAPDGEPRAGVCVVQHRINLLSLGLGRWLDPLVFAAMPLCLHKASARHYPLVSLHHCWGEVSLFEPLWSSILAETQVGAATVAFDTTDPMGEAVQKTVPLGRLGAAVGSIPWVVTCGRAPDCGPLNWPMENR